MWVYSTRPLLLTILCYIILPLMPNTRSAAKALRQSNKRKIQNDFWKKRIKDVLKSLRKQLDTDQVDIDIIKKEESLLYKVVDKASKNNVIHKNKANRIKAKISKKISVHEKPATETNQTKAKPRAKSKSTSKSKS